MRRFLLLAAIAVLLGTCAPAAPDVTPPNLPTVTMQDSTPSPAPAPSTTPQPAPSATASVTPAPTATATQACGEDPLCYLDGHFLFQRPIGPMGKQSIERSYPYGSTQGGKREIHHGVEFYNAQGTPILAAADGKVVFAGSDKLTLLSWVTGFYGNVVVIEHHFPGFPQTIYTLYAHQYKVNVTVGQEVKAGDLIGQVGATGTAAGSHLHFEVRLAKNDYKSSRNPELWLLPLPGTGVLAGQIEDTQGNLLKGEVNIQRIENGVLNTLSVASAQTYANESQPVNGDDVFHENFAVGELPAGDYRLTLLYNGNLYEQMIKIVEGKLTLVKFVLK
jgi:murein DD-endopeptidase MepM/ murein hydrolase activator NlpD